MMPIRTTPTYSESEDKTDHIVQDAERVNIENSYGGQVASRVDREIQFEQNEKSQVEADRWKGEFDDAGVVPGNDPNYDLDSLIRDGGKPTVVKDSYMEPATVEGGAPVEKLISDYQLPNKYNSQYPTPPYGLGRFLGKFEDKGGWIERGRDILDGSYTGSESGPPPSDSFAMSHVAFGVLAEGGDYDDFVGLMPKLQSQDNMRDAWVGAWNVRAEKTIGEAIENGEDLVGPYENQRVEISEKIKEDELYKVDGFISSAKIVYNNIEGMEFEGSDFELMRYMQTYMSFSRFNTVVKARGIVRAMNGSAEFNRAMYLIMTAYDNTENSAIQVGRGLLGVATDPMTYLPLAGAKLALFFKGANTVNALQKITIAGMGGVAVSAPEGFLYGSFDEFSRQVTEKGAGVREEYDLGRIAKTGAATSAFSAVVGGAVGAVGGALSSKAVRQASSEFIQTARKKSKEILGNESGEVVIRPKMQAKLKDAAETVDHEILTTASPKANAEMKKLVKNAGGIKRLSKHLQAMGVEPRLANRAQAMMKSSSEFPFEPPSVTANHLLRLDKTMPEAKLWYEGQEVLKRVFSNESDLDLVRGLAMLSHTSRNKGTLSNMIEFVKVRLAARTSRGVQATGLVSKEVVDRVMNAKDLDSMFKVIRKGNFEDGELKVKAFAETFASTLRDNPGLRKDLQTVVDIWVNRYFFPERINPNGMPMSSTPVQHARIQQHMREVEQILKEKTGNEWTPDMAQASLWFHTREQYAAHRGKAGQTGYTFDDTLRILANRYFDLPGKAENSRLVNAYIDQKLRDPNVTHILDHWGAPGRDILDPKFQGTGKTSKESARTDKLDRIFLYEAGREPEWVFKGDERTRTVIDSDKIYDLAKDPDGYKKIHNTVNNDELSALERNVVKDGYIGIQEGQTTIIFDPTKTHKLQRYNISVSPSVKKGLINQVRKTDPENADFLQTLSDLEKSGNTEEVYRIVEADISDMLDSPMIDIRDVLPSEDRWKGGKEFSLDINVDSADPTILKGRVASFLKKYKQMEGVVSEVTMKTVQKNQAKSLVFGIDGKTLSSRDVTKITKILDSNGIEGCKYIPERGVFVVHHIRDYINTKAKFHKIIDSALVELRSSYKKYDVTTKEISFKHENLKTNWKEDPLGEGYDKLIERQQTRERDLGVSVRLPIQQGAERRSGSLFQGAPDLYSDKAITYPYGKGPRVNPPKKKKTSSHKNISPETIGLWEKQGLLAD